MKETSYTETPPKETPPHKRKEAIITVSSLAVLAILAASGIVGYIGWFMQGDRLPDLHTIESQNFELGLATIAYTEDGEILDRYGHEVRTWVPFTSVEDTSSHDRIPDHVVHALVSIEDRRFWNHWGVDLWRTFSAVTQSVLNKIGLPFTLQGGSTITQQLARNLYNEQIGFEVSVKRKLQEMAAAIELERRYSKEEIIEMYLNTVPFRHNSFGIQAASQTYFGKTTADLDTLEAATLIGMLNKSTRYDPVRNPESSRNRRNSVLNRMIKDGFLESEFLAKYDTLNTPTHLQAAGVTDSFAPYAAEHVRITVRDLLREINASTDDEDQQYDLYTDGLRVYTTIDSRYQKHAQAAATSMADSLQAVADCEWSAPRSKRLDYGGDMEKYIQDQCHLDPDNRFAYFWDDNEDILTAFIQETLRYRRMRNSGVSEKRAMTQLQNNQMFIDSLKAEKTRLEVGFVVTEPSTGKVKAWVGGRDLRTGWLDHVDLTKRQPGSAFKPFLYAAAILNGWTPEDQYIDSVFSYPLPEGGYWAPNNFDRKPTHEYYTLRESLARSKNTIAAQLIHDLRPQQVINLAHELGIESELASVPSLSLGVSEVSLLEMVTAYSALANMGTRNSLELVTLIEDRYGKVLYTSLQESSVALDSTTAIVVIDMMRDGINKPYGTGPRIRGQFAQTGYDFAGKTGTTQEAADGWFMIMHPQMVAGAWLGFDDRRMSFRSTYWGQGAHNALFVVGDYLRRINADSLTALDRYVRFPDPVEPGEFVPVTSF